MASSVELRHFRYFAAVAERRHFTRAAADLGIAQPALSSQIRQLESMLGVLLFERTNRSVRLTPAGEVLLMYAKRILGDVVQAETAMQAYTEKIRGNLAIGALPILGDLFFPRLIAELAKALPVVRLSLREDRNERLIDGLHSGDLQAALIDTAGLADDALARIDAKEVFRSPLVVVMALSHPLANRANIKLAELQGERFIQFSGGSDARHRRLVALATEAGVDLTPAFVVTQSSLARSLAATGCGIALSPQWLNPPSRSAHRGTGFSGQADRVLGCAGLDGAWRDCLVERLARACRTLDQRRCVGSVMISAASRR